MHEEKYYALAVHELKQFSSLALECLVSQQGAENFQQ